MSKTTSETKATRGHTIREQTAPDKGDTSIASGKEAFPGKEPPDKGLSRTISGNKVPEI